ncbi:MAG: biotin/lipoyl-binding protein [Deltaproteobacteria bacterium]|nr:biotin/lipoyl-binding protein [Deltaproteobacteria bacterium]
MTEVRIPKTGDAVEEGTLVEWLVEDGARVERGDPLYLLETDKVAMQIEAPSAGVVARIGVPGEIYPVGELVATITERPG